MNAQDTEFVFGRMSGISRFIYEALGTTTSNGEVDYTVAGYVLVCRRIPYVSARI